MIPEKINLIIAQQTIDDGINKLRDAIFMMEHRNRDKDTTDEEAVIARLSQIKDTLWFNNINLNDTINDIGREMQERFFSFNEAGSISEVTRDRYEQLYPETPEITE